MSDNNFSSQLDEIRKLRQAKFENKSGIITKPIPYNYDLRKETLDWIKKCSRVEVMKERMDKVEKKDYESKMSKIQLEDLDHFAPSELNENFMVDLFKFSYSLQVLQNAYQSYQNHENKVPHILMIKELLAKSNRISASEDFIMELLRDYTNSNKNVLPIITTTNILELHNYPNAINFIMELFYSNPNIMISFEQLKMIYSQTNVNPVQFKILVEKCTNITSYSKCQKSGTERLNRDLIKNLIHEMESKYKVKLAINLYT